MQTTKVSDSFVVVDKEFMKLATESMKRVQELKEINEQLQSKNIASNSKLFYLEKQNKRYRALLERVCQVEDLEDVWDIEDDYSALEVEE